MSDTKHTPGPWRIGECQSVVADHPVPGMGGSDAVGFYGGHLVAESIAPQNRPIIAAAPELKQALADLLAELKGPMAGYWTEGLANFVQAGEELLERLDGDAGEGRAR